MNRNKHLLLWSSLGVLALLVTAAVQTNFLKDWRQIQASARADSGPLNVRLRQVVLPKLNVTDRCVSCHVGMSPGEQGISGNSLAAATTHRSDTIPAITAARCATADKAGQRTRRTRTVTCTSGPSR